MKTGVEEKFCFVYIFQTKYNFFFFLLCSDAKNKQQKIDYQSIDGKVQIFIYVSLDFF